MRSSLIQRELDLSFEINQINNASKKIPNKEIRGSDWDYLRLKREALKIQ